jgi:hypothetical protein
VVVAWIIGPNGFGASVGLENRLLPSRSLVEVDRIGPIALGVLLLGLTSRVEFACGKAAVGMWEDSHRIAAMDALFGRMGAYLVRHHTHMILQGPHALSEKLSDDVYNRA